MDGRKTSSRRTGAASSEQNPSHESGRSQRKISKTKLQPGDVALRETVIVPADARSDHSNSLYDVEAAKNSFKFDIAPSLVDIVKMLTS